MSISMRKIQIVDKKNNKIHLVSIINHQDFLNYLPNYSDDCDYLDIFFSYFDPFLESNLYMEIGANPNSHEFLYKCLSNKYDIVVV